MEKSWKDSLLTLSFLRHQILAQVPEATFCSNNSAEKHLKINQELAAKPQPPWKRSSREKNINNNNKKKESCFHGQDLGSITNQKYSQGNHPWVPKLLHVCLWSHPTIPWGKGMWEFSLEQENPCQGTSTPQISWKSSFFLQNNPRSKRFLCLVVSSFWKEIAQGFTAIRPVTKPLLQNNFLCSLLEILHSQDFGEPKGTPKPPLESASKPLNYII